MLHEESNIAVGLATFLPTASEKVWLDPYNNRNQIMKTEDQVSQVGMYVLDTVS